MLNKDELILDKIRSLTLSDYETGKDIICRLTQLEDPTLTCTSEADEVTDAQGAPISRLYKNKQAKFSATNSLISLNLAAAQYGTTKQVADNKNQIIVPTYDLLDIDNGKVKLKNKPADISKVTKIYVVEKGRLGKAYTAGSAASDTEFLIAEDGTITVPTTVTSGKVYVEYEYSSENAMKIVNKASEFPSTVRTRVYCYFRDKCDDNKLYSGIIVANRSKLNPESIELALTSTGKHSFEIDMLKDYCDEENDELFTIIVAE